VPYWAPLPDGLSPAHRQLVTELRALKDRHRWTFKQMGRMTHYSHASWERWLNGKRLVTHDALGALLAVAEADDAALLARHAQALSADAGAVAEPAGDAGPVGADLPRNAQVPAAVGDFAGRDDEITALGEALCGPAPGSPADALPGRSRIAAVTGGGGLGKTTLALAAAHRLADRFPDGQLFADLHGMDPVPRSPVDVLAQWLADLGVTLDRIPEQAEARAAHFRSLLHGRRMLIVLDNVHRAAQVQPLLPAAPGCAVLITSRDRLGTLPGCVRLELGPLPDFEALTLLENIVGEGRLRAEPTATGGILAACAGLPLALRIAGARLAIRPSWAVEDLAARLADRRRVLDELSVADLAVRANLDASHAYLTATAPDLGHGVDPAVVFRIAALVPASAFGVAEVVVLLGEEAGTREADVESALEHLVDIHLLTARGRGRYGFHDLIRAYALERLEDAEPPERRDPALLRLIGWYADGFEAASAVIGQTIGLLPAVAVPGTPAPPALPDRDAATDWCARHVEAASAAIDAAPLCGRPDLAARIALYMFAYAYIDITVNYQNCLERALAIAEADHDRAAEAWLLTRLGVWHGIWAHGDLSLSVLEQALAAHRAVGDPTGELRVLGNLATAYGAAGQYQRALEKGQQALDRYRASPQVQLGDFEATTLHGMADAYLRLDQFEAAVDHFRRALARYAPDGHAQHRAYGLSGLGNAYRGLGDFDQAVACIEESRELSVRNNDRQGQADALHSLGRAFAHFGQADRARDCWKQALEIFEAVGFTPGLEETTASLALLDAGGG